MSTPPNPLTSPETNVVLTGDGTTQADSELVSGVPPSQIPAPQ